MELSLLKICEIARLFSLRVHASLTAALQSWRWGGFVVLIERGLRFRCVTRLTYFGLFVAFLWSRDLDGSGGLTRSFY